LEKEEEKSILACRGKQQDSLLYYSPSRPYSASSRDYLTVPPKSAVHGIASEPRTSGRLPVLSEPTQSCHSRKSLSGFNYNAGTLATVEASLLGPVVTSCPPRSYCIPPCLLLMLPLSHCLGTAANCYTPLLSIQALGSGRGARLVKFTPTRAAHKPVT